MTSAPMTDTAIKTTIAPRAPTVLPFSWLIAPAVSGALLWLCFFPVALDWVAWFALVPFLALVRSEVRPRRLYLAAYLGGSVFYWPVLQWMRVADWRMYGSWAFAALACAAYFPIALALLRMLDKRTRWPFAITLPLIWTGLEFVRSFFITGFAWYYLGHTQHANLHLIQISDLTGVYGVSFLVAMVNGLIFDIVSVPAGVRSWLRIDLHVAPYGWRGLAALTAVTSILLFATWEYGGWCLMKETFKIGPRVALLQASLDQRERTQVWKDLEVLGAGNVNVGVLKYYRDLLERSFDHIPRPDLIVWPETSLPTKYDELPRDLNHIPANVMAEAEQVRLGMLMYPSAMRVHHLFGVNSRVFDDDGSFKHYNSAVLFGLNGKEERYDKIHRIPFGEYLPLVDWLPFVKILSPYEFDYSIHAGTRMTRFHLKTEAPLLKQPAVNLDGEPNLVDYTFGVLICYEDTDPFLARQYVITQPEGGPVDFLINMSNDGWFDGTSEHEQHLAISRFRAVETRRAVARAVNMGISAVIDSNGRVLLPSEQPPPQGRTLKYWAVLDDNDRVPNLPPEEWHKFKKVPGVMVANIPIDDRTSFYAYAGDWLPEGCWAILALVMVLRWRPIPRS